MMGVAINDIPKAVCTATHRYCRFTMTDWHDHMPMRLMSKNDWRNYSKAILRQIGFDTRHTVKSYMPTPCEIIFSQEVDTYANAESEALT